jgi:hypothetical protein
MHKRKVVKEGNFAPFCEPHNTHEILWTMPDRMGIFLEIRTIRYHNFTPISSSTTARNIKWARSQRRVQEEHQ